MVVIRKELYGHKSTTRRFREFFLNQHAFVLKSENVIALGMHDKEREEAGEGILKYKEIDLSIGR